MNTTTTKQQITSLQRRALISGLLAAGAVFIGAQSYAQGQAPFAFLTVSEEGQQPLEIPIPLERAEKGWVIPELTLGSETAGWAVTVSGDLNPDPAIAYGIAVVDFGAPSVFGFFFGTPIVPTSAPNLVSASISGGLTDFTGDGIALIPTVGLTVQKSEVSPPPTSMGVDVGAPFIAGAGTPGALHVYGPFSAGPLAGPGPGPWTFLSTSVDFGLSGGGDIAALTGFASIVIPEVNGGAVLGALALIGGIALRRKYGNR